MRPVVRNIIVIALIAIVSIWLISAAASFFGRMSDDDDSTSEPTIDLTDRSYEDTRVVLITAGEITADEDYREISVSVSASERAVEVTRGYQRVSERRETFPNNQLAYAKFLAALQNVGFTLSDDEVERQDPDSLCPFGKRYSYQLLDGSSQVVSTWSTSCGNIDGSYAGDASDTRKLFQNQIPDYRSIIRGVQL